MGESEWRSHCSPRHVAAHVDAHCPACTGRPHVQSTWGCSPRLMWDVGMWDVVRRGTGCQTTRWGSSVVRSVATYFARGSGRGGCKRAPAAVQRGRGACSERGGLQRKVSQKTVTPHLLVTVCTVQVYIPPSSDGMWTLRTGPNTSYFACHTEPVRLTEHFQV